MSLFCLQCLVPLRIDWRWSDIFFSKFTFAEKCHSFKAWSIFAGKTKQFQGRFFSGQISHLWDLLVTSGKRGGDIWIKAYSWKQMFWHKYASHAYWGFFVLFSCLMLIRLQAFLFLKKPKPSKILQSWIVFLWQCKHLPWGAEMFLRLGEGANPTETAGLCLMLLHREPKTFQGFEAMAINREETGLFYKQILRNWIAVRHCSLPAIFSFQESPSSAGWWHGLGSSFSWLWYPDVLLELEVTTWVWNSLTYQKGGWCDTFFCMLGFCCSI